MTDLIQRGVIYHIHCFESDLYIILYVTIGFLPLWLEGGKQIIWKDGER